MSTSPQPPPGFRIIPPEWLEKNPLPGDGYCIIKDRLSDMWGKSGYRNVILDPDFIRRFHYATAQPLDCFSPPTDFRALCEEMRTTIQNAINSAVEPDKAHFASMVPLAPLREALTRANAALKETQP